MVLNGLNFMLTLQVCNIWNEIMWAIFSNSEQKCFYRAAFCSVWMFATHIQLKLKQSATALAAVDKCNSFLCYAFKKRVSEKSW